MTTFLNLVKLLHLYNKSLSSNRIIKISHYVSSTSFKNLFLRYSSLAFSDLENVTTEAKISKIVTNAQKSGVVSKTDIDKFLKELRDDDSLDSTQLITLLNSCGNVAAYQSQKCRQNIVSDIWSKFKSIRKIPLDATHYNALLQTYLENEYDFDPSEVLAEMKEYHISPTTRTYEKLILQYCKKGNISEAQKLLELMKNEHIPRTENIFNYLITGYTENSDMKTALEVLDTMTSYGIRHSAETYAALMYAYAKRGDIENIRQKLAECSVHNIKISKHHLFNIVYNLAINGHTEHVNEILILEPGDQSDTKEYVKCIIKLIDNELYNVAYTVFKFIPRHRLKYGGLEKTGLKNLMEKLVFSNVQSEKIINFCGIMADEKLDRVALKLAVDIYLKSGQYHCISPVLADLKKCGGVLAKNSIHSLCIMFDETKDENDRTKMLNIIEEITRLFGTSPRAGSIKHYILPHLKGEPHEIMSILANHGIPYVTAANALVHHLLEKNRIKDAKNLVFASKNCIKTKLLRKPLIDAFINTKDTETFVAMLKFQYDVLCNTSTLVEEDDVEAEKITNLQYIDTCVKQCLDILPENQDIFIDLLNKLVLDGLSGLSLQTAQDIEEILGENLTPEVTKTIKLLTCENLMSIADTGRVWNKDAGFINIEKVKDDISDIPEIVDAKPAMNDIKYFFKNEEEARQELKKLESRNTTVIQDGLCAKYISIYCALKDMEKAEYWMNMLKKICPEPELDRAKILSYAILLVENNRIEDALQCLTMTRKDEIEERLSLSAKLLSTVAETGNCETVDEFVHVLQYHHYFKMIKQDILRSFVKVRLIAGRTEDALNKFEWACNHYKMTPYKYELMIKFIQEEDATSLLRVTTQIQQMSGEEYVLFDLAVCFLKCAQFDRAAKVIENLNLKSYKRGLRILSIAKKFFENNEIVNLEAMYELVKTKVTNREPISLLLLQSYDSQNDLQKALKLWTEMEKENIRPSVEFSTALTNICERNGQNVPTMYIPFESGSFSIST